MKNDKTDTPRTDAVFWKFHTHDDIVNLARDLERELAISLENQCKAQAEVERLTKRPFGCKCETFREKALGDGCEECNKALVIEMLTDERDELDAEVDRLNNILENTRMSRDTMIEDRNLLDQELAASKAEVERLKAQLSRAVAIGEALSSELYFPDFVNELNAFKASLSSPSSL
jgi:chromosome segregation ATPase